MIKILISTLAIYIAVCLFMYVMQRHLIYFPSHELGASKKFSEVKIQTEDHLELTAWYLPGQKNHPTLIYFHGNSGNIAMREDNVASYLQRGMGVLLVEYRGYGGNQGEPTEVGLYRDAEAAYQFILNQDIASDSIVVFGESLGSAVAIELAKQYPVAAVILQSPLTSVADVGQLHYPFLPIKLLLKDRFNSIEKIDQINAPVIIAHGELDSVVPVRLANQLFSRALQPKALFIYTGKLHHNLNPFEIAKDALNFLCQQPKFYKSSLC